MYARRRALLSLTALLVLIVGQSAGATFMHGPYTGTNVDFTVIDETTQSGFGTADPEPLLGTMSTLGDTLSWSPTMFNATAAGAFDFDEDKSNLEIHMTALSAGALDSITLNEAGTVEFLSGGTSATNALLSLSGVLTVTAGGNVYIYNFGADADPVAVTFSAGLNPPGPGGGALFDAPTDGTSPIAWTATASFDVVALLAGSGEFASATDAVLTIDDSLIVASESGTTADATKTSFEVVVPEPATGALLAGGLTLLGIRARRRRV